MSKERLTRLNEVGFVWRVYSQVRLLTDPKRRATRPKKSSTRFTRSRTLRDGLLGAPFKCKKAAVSFNSSWVSAPHVRFGSKADVASGSRDVRFTPKSGHCLGRPSFAVGNSASHPWSSELTSVGNCRRSAGFAHYLAQCSWTRC